ncbi:hypothetical protein EN745_16945 [Mesorhizobium sp. M4A.F.Ca.ET.022.05.2.1]|nr:hypothetical protein EN745_16945 [Mesorhizobium sp. M4A.F.Ca.ET.022.05.2.1]
MQEEQRRLAAILATDVAGFSRLMATDESGTLGRLRRLRAEVFEAQNRSAAGRRDPLLLRLVDLGSPP